MEMLLGPTIIDIVSRIIAGIIAAIITSWITTRERKVPKPKEKKRHDYRAWTVGVVTFLVVFYLIGYFSPKPTVDITSPMNRELIDVQIGGTGEGYFSVSGYSRRVTDSQLRIYILVHPADPFAEGWWIQPSVVMNTDGSWYGRAQIGTSKYPPHVGDIVDIQAIVTSSERIQNRLWVNDPEDLNPKAKSKISITIGSITTPSGKD